MDVPSFLQPQTDSQYANSVYVHSIFQHSKPLGFSKTIWWPSADPSTVVLFIPGNPGLSEFYIPVLDRFTGAESQAKRSALCVLTVSYNHKHSTYSKRAKSFLGLSTAFSLYYIEVLTSFASDLFENSICVVL
ncbi:Esterase lipase partial [Lentinula edodes]|uniref:Esterase lipase partial n=1 Tax=Lentinula edodes TaxID=5353 RepID=A0A1Q3EAY9_LENED|nr:Esterase lipase partial [Lentinula edodes]